MNTNSNHTPGPWKLAVGVIEPDKVWREDENGNETLIARGIENPADAPLIAAAPELLGALQSIAENLQNHAMTTEQEKQFRHHPELESWRVYLSSLIIQARNEAAYAIAKVTGQK
jgi:hypothetical protein